jgi:hypothetical protein
MLKKTRKERNRKKTLNKRLSKNNKKHTFRRKNTKNLTKKNKMLGGSLCIFETPEGSNRYGCNACAVNTYKFTKPSRYFYYHGNEDTLFGFNSHLFKHLDKIELLRDSLTNINFVKTPQNLVLFSLNYGKYPILKLFIDEIKRIINYNHLTYATLKQTKNNDSYNNMFTSGPFADEFYPRLMITWSKKSRLPKNNPPLPITGVDPYTKFVQLHSLSYVDQPDNPVCTLKKNLTGNNDVTDSQKDNFLPTNEQYKNADLTASTVADYIQPAIDKAERDKAINDAAALKRQQEKEAALKRQQEKEAEEKKLVCENIEITKSLIMRLNELINIVELRIKTTLVIFNNNLDEICDALRNHKEGTPINKINAELKANINAIIKYLKDNGLNNPSTQNDLVSAGKNLIKDNNETKNRGLTELNTILTVFIELKEEAIKAAAARVIQNDAEAEAVILNDARAILNNADAAPVSRDDAKAVPQMESGLSKKKKREERRKMEKREVLDEDSS